MQIFGNLRFGSPHQALYQLTNEARSFLNTSALTFRQSALSLLTDHSQHKDTFLKKKRFRLIKINVN
jgi:hypothetical protein